MIGSGECGIDGGNLTWTLTSDGVITVSGEGEMADGSPWKDLMTNILVGRLGYASVSELEQAITSGTADMAAYMTAAMEYDTFFKKAVIEEGVTSVGAGAFSDISLTEVSLPSTLTKIGDSSFYNCHLASVALPEGLKEIGPRAFYNNDFTEFTVPSSVETLANDFLDYNRKLQTLTMLSDAPLAEILLPSVDQDFPFETYDAYSDYDTYCTLINVINGLLNSDYNLAVALPQYIYSYHMTAEQARAFVESMSALERTETYAQLGIPADAADEQAVALLTARINGILGTEFTSDGLFNLQPVFAGSPELFMDVYPNNYSVYYMLNSVYQLLIALRDDREGYKNKLGKTDDEIDAELTEMYAYLAEEFGIEASTVDGAIAGHIAKVNEVLGKTEENAYTEATLGSVYWVYSDFTDALLTAVLQKFGFEEYPGELSINSGYIGDAFLAPWFTIRVSCGNANIAFLDEYEIGYEIVHTIVEHEAQAPTCVDPGWDAYETCSKCDYTTYGGEIGANGIHTPVVVNAREATATEDGYTGDTICSVCQAPLATGEVIPATGGQEEDPGDQPSGGENLCKWCGQPHNGFFGKLVGFFHSILYFFAHLFGRR